MVEIQRKQIEFLLSDKLPQEKQDEVKAAIQRSIDASDVLYNTLLEKAMQEPA